MHADEHAELAALMRAVRAGCKLSLERLYLLTSDRLFGIVLRITRDRIDAEEVLQETYVEVWNWRERFDENCGPVDLWLAGIAHCSAIDSLRHRQVCSHAIMEAAVDNHQPTSASARALPTDRQTTLALALHDGMSRGEIALRLQRPIGTVKAWLRASLADMRQERAGHPRLVECPSSDRHPRHVVNLTLVRGGPVERDALPPVVVLHDGEAPVRHVAVL